MSTGSEQSSAGAARSTATCRNETVIFKENTALESPGLRTRPRQAPGSGPAVLTAIQDARSAHRLEVSCLVHTAHSSSMMIAVSRLLFDEGADVVEADTHLDGDYMSMFFLLHPSACGPSSWRALLSKVNASVLAWSSDAAFSKSCTCQVHNVTVEGHSESLCFRTVWDALHDCGLQILSCSMQTHKAKLGERRADQYCGAALDVSASRDSHEAGVASDMSFVVVDLLQQLSDADRQSAVAESMVNACRIGDAAACSVGITDLSSNASEPSDHQSASHCFCQQRPHPSGIGSGLCLDSYLEPREDGRKRFIPAEADENSELAAVELFLDETMSKTSTCIEIECRNRKGLMYDVLRTAGAAGLHVVQARARKQPHGSATIHLFLRDPEFQPITDQSLLHGVLHQLRSAIMEPLHVVVVPSEEGVLDVLVVTALDSGRRGRPRVARDVADVLASESLRIEAAFVGAAGDCVDLDRIPGDIMHEMISYLQFPQLRRREHDPWTTSWVEEEDNRLLVYTPRMTDSPLFSPCADTASKDGGAPGSGGRNSSQGHRPLRAPSRPPAAPSCDARSAASEEPGTVPMLHDLERHFCSAFVDDDFVPEEERAAPVAPQRSMLSGSMAKGAWGWDCGRLPLAAGKVGGRLGLGKQESNLETGLSFFGPATADSHIPEELGQMVEMHHFVVATDDHEAGMACRSLATLRSLLHDKLMGLPPSS